jgi:hypothetical protein
LVAEKAKSRLLEFFSLRGEEPVRNQSELGLPPPPALAVSDGKSVAVILHLTKEELLNGNALLRTVVNAAAHRGRANRLYIAIPKLYAASVDGAILQDNGIGLIVYDEKRVFESIPARNVELDAERPQGESLSEIRSELAETRQEVRSLEAALLSASREIKDLKEAVRELASRRPARATVRAERSRVRLAVEVPEGSSDEGLPSFLKGNPWVEVLSGRGEEE